MSFYQEFKKFMRRGNALEMAVGILLGTSFMKIVDVLVNHVLMPPIGVLIRGIDFGGFRITLVEASGQNPAVTIDYGLLINAVMNFVVVGISVFIFMTVLRKLHLKDSLSTKQTCPECKMEIPIDARRCGYCTAAL